MPAGSPGQTFWRWAGRTTCITRFPTPAAGTAWCGARMDTSPACRNRTATRATGGTSSPGGMCWTRRQRRRTSSTAYMWTATRAGTGWRATPIWSPRSSCRRATIRAATLTTRSRWGQRRQRDVDQCGQCEPVWAGRARVLREDGDHQLAERFSIELRQQRGRLGRHSGGGHGRNAGQRDHAAGSEGAGVGGAQLSCTWCSPEVCEQQLGEGGGVVRGSVQSAATAAGGAGRHGGGELVDGGAGRCELQPVVWAVCVAGGELGHRGVEDRVAGRRGCGRAGGERGDGGQQLPQYSAGRGGSR